MRVVKKINNKSGSKESYKNQETEKVQRNKIKPPESCDSSGFLERKTNRDIREKP